MATNNKKNVEAPKNDFAIAFGTINYIIMGIGLLLLAIGYILLCGGGSDDPNTFTPAMFDSRRLVVAPILIVVGFIAEIVAIMLKPSDKKQDNAEE